MRSSSEVLSRESDLTRGKACGQANSISGSSVVTAKVLGGTCQDIRTQHRSQHTVDARNAGLSTSHQAVFDRPTRVVVEEAQPTTPSSLQSEYDGSSKPGSMP